MCHHCYKPDDVCSGECWGDREDCGNAQCPEMFGVDPATLTKCTCCRKKFCEQCSECTEETCDGCAKRVCDHNYDSYPEPTTICEWCKKKFCAACVKKTVTAKCQERDGCEDPMCSHDGTTPWSGTLVDIVCSPRHPAQFEPPYLESHGIL